MDQGKQLRRSAGDACRRRARALLRKARRANARLDTSHDPEALHSLRISIRRLRTFLRSYRPHMGRAARRGIRRRLGKLSSSTNAQRDADVHVAWLVGQLETQPLRPTVRSGMRYLLDELESRQQHMRQASIQPLRRGFKRTASRLKKKLRAAGKTPSRETMAEATAAVVQRETTRLRDDLAQVRSLHQDEPLHDARLTAKRLRYLLEPTRKAIPVAADAVTALRRLQDLLGDIRDMWTLESRVRRLVRGAAKEWSGSLMDAVALDDAPILSAAARGELRKCFALASVIGQVRREQRRLFRQVEQEWLNGQGTQLFELLQRVTDELLGIHVLPNPEPTLQLMNT